MFATKSCAEMELRMGRGVVCLGSSVMASASDLSARPISAGLFNSLAACNGKGRPAAPPYDWLRPLTAAPRNAAERRRPEIVAHRASGAPPHDALVQEGEYLPR